MSFLLRASVLCTANEGSEMFYIVLSLTYLLSGLGNNSGSFGIIFSIHDTFRIVGFLFFLKTLPEKLFHRKSLRNGMCQSPNQSPDIDTT